MSVRGPAWGAAMAKKSATAARSEQSGTSNHRCQARELRAAGEDGSRSARARRPPAIKARAGAGQGVVLLSRGEGEEEKDEAGPEEEGEGCSAPIPLMSR